MKRLLYTLLLGALSLGAQPAAKPKTYKDLRYPPLKDVKIPEVTSFTLANGMKVYLLENRRLPLVDGGVRVRVGDLWDPKDRSALPT